MVRRRTLTTSIDFDGPFFEKDPVKTLKANIAELMATMARQGESDVRVQLQAGEGGRQPIRGVQPARVSGHVVGRVRSLAGKPWSSTAVVSVNAAGRPRRQAIAIKAAAARIEAQGHPFRRTATRLRRVTANFAKGLE